MYPILRQNTGFVNGLMEGYNKLMAKRRTKKQKIKTQKRSQTKRKSKKIIITADKSDKKKLIVKDLLKTLWVSLVLVGLLVGAYIYLNQ